MTKAPHYMDMLSLKGRGYVVLGAGQGIGEQAAIALHQAGAAVFCVDVDASHAERVAREVKGHACVADATKREDIERVFSEAKKVFGGVNGVVDVIGIARLKPSTEMTDEDWAWQFDMVFKHAMLALRIGGPIVAESGGGPFTFVGSLSGNRAIPTQVGYGSAKAALHHLVRTSAVELGPKNIRVNLLAPGFIRTPRLETILSPDQWANIEGAIPLRRAAQMQEIASAMLFLSSDMASHITGAIIPIDGGIECGAALPQIGWKPTKQQQGS